MKPAPKWQYDEGRSLKNGMNLIRLTDEGWNVLKGKR